MRRIKVTSENGEETFVDLTEEVLGANPDLQAALDRLSRKAKDKDFEKGPIYESGGGHDKGPIYESGPDHDKGPAYDRKIGR